MEMQTEEDQNIIREYEHYQGQAEAYGKNIELINSNLTELGSVEASLDQLKDVDKDSEALVPIGGGSFVKARIVDNKTVIVDIDHTGRIARSRIVHVTITVSVCTACFYDVRNTVVVGVYI